MPKQYPGFHCQSIGLTVSILSQSHISPPEDAVYKTWPKVAPANITQGLIMELNTYANNHNLPSLSMYYWIKALYRDSWPADELEPTDAAIRRSISSLKLQRRKLVVSHKADELSTFSSLPYSLPAVQTDKAAAAVTVTQKGNHQCPSQLQEKECAEDVALSLAKELHQSEQALSSVESNYAKLQEKLSHYKPRNVHKRETRAHEKIKHLEESVQQLQRDVLELQQKLEIEKKQTSLYKLRWWRIKQKLGKLDQKEDTLAKDNAQQVLDLEEKIDELEQMNAELYDMHASKSTVIKCFHNGRFNDKMRECCINLLAMNVGINNVCKIINCVLSLSGHTADRLPSSSALGNMLLEARSLAHLQLGEEIPKEEYATLHSDATTKFGDKFSSFQISTSESSYSLCLADMKSGSTLDAMELLQETLYTVEKTCDFIEGSTSSNTGAKILAAVKNTMSDRHVVEKNFNCLLEEYRSEVLPQVVESWCELTEEQKEVMSKMNNFFCGLHFLVALADCSAEVLKQWETIHELPPVQESGTIRLIRMVCKAVHKHGSERYGCQVAFATYLRRHAGIVTVPLAKFKGNRFNIVFHNGGGVYCLYQHLINFFCGVHGTPNKLNQAILADLRNPVLVAGCRAMGIISKSITGPLWRLMESKVNIAKLSEAYQEMDKAFQRWSNDASVLLSREETVEPEHVRTDRVTAELFKECDSDVIVIELLQMLMQAFHLTAARLLGDHLEGEYADPPTQTIREARSVPATNVRSERDFAQLDRLMREKPNASTIAIEAMVLYSNNKTARWLSQKTADEKTQLFAACMKLGRQQRKVYKQRREEIHAFRQEQNRLKEERIRARCKKITEEKERLTKEIVKFGLWSTGDEVARQLALIKGVTKQRNAIKIQLQFRQKVLCQQYPDRSIFHVSAGGKQKSVRDLQQNLTLLIEDQHVH